MKFAKEIIVSIENEGNDEFLVVHKTANDAAEQNVKKVCGVYRLVKTIIVEGIVQVRDH